ncbi:50S ribosomal protein L22 [Ammonifex thiophilus]|uniref:Large ribosomal subunit protein uL22 n=1 Tax=Ammonifex thiophilus TaxID=444093 RepID=A0A3D8P3D5_9THEO|nr:50S ribosomal protein L22 [Ammonifex thiophilus]RDV83368.1 50S ribosomal protein L22 [Ammonifex thiophilus]
MNGKEARATAKYVRISPFKARQVIDLIRGKRVDEAFAILRFTPRKAARLIEKVLRSAVANAEHNYDMIASELVVLRAYVDEGPTLKRYRPRAYGRADLRRRRTSHITVVVGEKGGK